MFIFRKKSELSYGYEAYRALRAWLFEKSRRAVAGRGRNCGLKLDLMSLLQLRLRLEYERAVSAAAADAVM